MQVQMKHATIVVSFVIRLKNRSVNPELSMCECSK